MIVAQGQTQLAVQCVAAASALRAQMGTPLRPADEAAVEQTLATARWNLGDNVFAAVWAEAQALPIEQLLGSIGMTVEELA